MLIDRLGWRAKTALGWAAVVVTLLLVGALVLPKGINAGAVALGVVFGCLDALTAMGLVLVFRSSRVINFAQASFGGLAAAVMVIMVVAWHVPFLLAVPVALLLALGSGAATDRFVVRRLIRSPKLLLTVATIGVGQVVAAVQIGLPVLLAKNLSAFSVYHTPLYGLHFSIASTYFTGDSVLAVGVVVVVLVALAWFLGRTDLGLAIRAAADSNERALLLGIPVATLSLVSWTLAAGLSGIGTMLAVPVEGQNLGQVIGPEGLLVPLAAAVIARFESLPVAFGAALGIDVAEQVIFWSHPQSSSVDLAVFLIILVALLLQRRHMGRLASSLGDVLSVKLIRPVPAQIRRLSTYRAARLALGLVLVALAVVVVPLTLGAGQLFVAASAAIFAIVAVSLVPLTGWAGQISLGQFALAGAGAATTGALLVHFDVDLFLALGASAVVGALVALVIGLPALRIPGTYLAAVTMAYAVPVSSYFLSQIYFPQIAETDVVRPELFGRVTLESPRVFYWLCLALLVVVLHLTRNLRNSRTGRAMVATRDNEMAAASFSISPLRMKLLAFAYAGALAAVAGGLYIVGNRGLGFSGIDPELSIDVFLMVAIGGLGSTTGAVMGVVYVEAMQYLLPGYAQLLATGGGLLVLLLVVPGGLGQIVFDGRDRLLRWLARGRGIESSALWDTARFAPAGADGAVRRVAPVGAAAAAAAVDGDGDGDGTAAGDGDGRDGTGRSTAGGEEPMLVCDRVGAAYGPVDVLFGVDMTVDRGEVVGLLGTNGAGKSTLLRVVSGLMPLKGGRLRFEGADLAAAGPVARVKRGVVTVPGGRWVFPSLTVEENLQVAGWRARHDGGSPDAALERALELFPALRARWHSKAGNLSGGEQQMLTIAQALLCNPRLLLIDELSLGLAPVVVAGLLGAVRQMVGDGVTVVVVEQSVNLAMELADRAVFLERGQVRFTGPTAELIGRDDLLRSVFLAGGAARGTTPPVAGAGSAPARARRRPTVGEGDGGGSSEEVFAVREVRKRFGGVRALDDVSFSVRRGEILGIIGSNGAGKTTLFDVCSGLLSPDAGHVVLEGRHVTDLSAPRRAALGMGRVFQDARLFPSLTVAEVVAVAFERHVAVRDPLLALANMSSARQSEEEIADGVDELLEQLHLERYRDSFVSELSTGTRRVVELACTMAHEPSLVLLDEPSSGLAQRETETLGHLLLEFQQATGATMVLIEHDIPLVSSVADRLLCMHLGAVLCQGTPDEVLADPSVAASYLGESDVAVRRSGARVLEPSAAATGATA
ncbi:MAG TPA: ATP-binding cassette domain-containing protein [Acidimicrobiales bacterium]|nr:ATP-binding cassette domain-containing protein [Acidimicrobiales bacterium]